MWCNAPGMAGWLLGIDSPSHAGGSLMPSCPGARHCLPRSTQACTWHDATSNLRAPENNSQPPRERVQCIPNKGGGVRSIEGDEGTSSRAKSNSKLSHSSWYMSPPTPPLGGCGSLRGGVCAHPPSPRRGPAGAVAGTERMPLPLSAAPGVDASPQPAGMAPSSAPWASRAASACLPAAALCWISSRRRSDTMAAEAAWPSSCCVV